MSVLLPARVLDDVDAIEIGRDGLVVERRGQRGLLLPQVASEREWDRYRFLDETCVKAGLDPEAWRDVDTTVWVFEAREFTEC